MKTLIIAEAGVNHNANIDIAIELVDQACNAKADIIKFQTFTPSEIVTKYGLKATYQNGAYHEEDMPLYLVVCDATDKWSNGGIIGVWQMDGDKVNGLLKESSKISLSKFMKHGKRKRTDVDTIGWTRWYNTISKRVPVRASCNI